MMTFERFRTAVGEMDDLGAFLGDESLTGVSGRLYRHGLYYIARTADGRWSLVLGNTERVSDDLGALERELYDFAVAEGIE